MATYALISTSEDLHCTTSRPCLTSLSPELVRQRHTVRVSRTETWQLRYQRSSSWRKWGRSDAFARKGRRKVPRSCCQLGALGAVTKVTLDIQPTFTMRQDVYQNLPLAELEEHFENIVSSGYSVSLFTDWQNKRVNEVWISAA